METLDYVKAVVIFLILIFGLIFALTATNLVHCKSIGQSWCDAYYSIVGYPKVLIVYGFDGLGNAEKLVDILSNRELFRLRVQIQNLDYIKTTDYLDNYKMIIVTQARTMTSDQLKLFDDFATKGGILIWTGDAGTSRVADEKKPSDYNLDSSNVWVRITSDNIAFDFSKTISAEYIANFCTYTNCNDPYKGFDGYLIKESSDNSISGGLAPNTALNGDFALVNLVNNTSTKMDISVDFKTNIISKDNSNTKGLNTNVVPFMIRTGLGKNVIYIASPIENLISSTDTIKFGATNTGTEIPTTIRKLFEEYFGQLK